MADAMYAETFYTAKVIGSTILGAYCHWTGHPEGGVDQNMSAEVRGDVSLLLSGRLVSEDRQQGFLDSLLQGYEELGRDVFAQLNGTFAGLLIDRPRGQVFLFNDRYGFERVYVCETDGATYFASEAKALLAVQPKTRAFDEQGLSQWLGMGCTV
ncbi:MAG: hypothetical protein R3F19_30755, partial [Verrucomicrobiales bacterium]